MESVPRIAYLYSRYPLISQTFCDVEMLSLEESGIELVAGSIHPPVDSMRHDMISRLKAPVLHAPPSPVVKELVCQAKQAGTWPAEMIAEHDRKYGETFKAETRARNALYFAEQFRRHGVTHLHVPFANRALHTALFIREMTGLPLSFTTHGQDFMVDLGSDELLREMCGASEFVVAVCDYSQRLLQELCPDSKEKIIRVYNGLDVAEFPRTKDHVAGQSFRILSVGRLIEFKGFHHLIDAVAVLAGQDHPVELRIVGSGPWADRLRQQAEALGVSDRVVFLGQQGSEAVQNELQAADVFALGCIVDSKGASDLLPTVITEAMLTGLPVVSTRIAGVPEMVVDGETGILNEPGDSDGMADSLGRLAGDPGLRQRMGAAGRRLAETKFSKEITIPRLSDAYLKHSRVPATTPVRTGTLAFFDFDLPGRGEWFAGEAFALEDALVLGTCHANAKPDPQWCGHLKNVEWLPDGIVAEMEWRSRREWRMQLETLRMDGFTSVDGEVYLRAARWAVLLACRVRSASTDCPLLYAPGIEESLAAWLCSRLVEVRLALAFDNGERWNRSVLDKLAADAVILSDGSEKRRDGDDRLRHGRRTGHFVVGPLKIRTRPEAIPDSERGGMLENWLEEAP